MARALEESPPDRRSIDTARFPWRWSGTWLPEETARAAVEYVARRAWQERSR